MHDPVVDVLQREALPEVAAALRKRLKSIIDRWLDLVRKVLPEADQLTMAQLRDNTPQMLEQLAEALELAFPVTEQEVVPVSSTHGEVRFHQQFNLNELLLEYHLLRRVVIEELRDELGRPMTPAEAEGVHLGIDTAIRRAAVTFSEYQGEQVRAGAEAQAKYLSFLSHDLRGALNSVLLMVEVLRQDLEQHPQFDQSLKDLDLMKRSIHDTVATMDRFLHAERLRKGMFQVQPVEFDLKQFIEELAREHALQARQKGLELVQDVPPGLKIVSDRNLLQLIMQNLLGNAIKFSRQGKVRVSADSVDGEIRITVSDEGAGIPADELEKLFTPFSRGQTHGEPGAGLGLSIARQATALVQGRLRAESESGRGSRFHIEVPKRLEPATGDAG